MGPQNSDPNNPSSDAPASPIQSDLSSGLTATTDINQPPVPSIPAEPPTTSFGMGSVNPLPPESNSPLPDPIPSTTPNPLSVPDPIPAAPEPQVPPVESAPPTFNWSNPGGAPEPTIPATAAIPEQPVAPTEPTIPSFSPPAAPEFAPPTSSESTPTDFSQLSGQASDQPVYSPPLSQPETLVVPPSSPEPTTLQADGGRHGIPKWVIFVGAGLLLAVLGASAYFILGIGQTQTDSLPATEQQTLITPPVASPTIQQPTPATSSAGFGSFAGSPSPLATSAADLLRQRQQAK